MRMNAKIRRHRLAHTVNFVVLVVVVVVVKVVVVVVGRRSRVGEDGGGVSVPERIRGASAFLGGGMLLLLHRHRGGRSLAGLVWPCWKPVLFLYISRGRGCKRDKLRSDHCLSRGM